MFEWLRQTPLGQYATHAHAYVDIFSLTIQFLAWLLYQTISIAMLLGFILLVLAFVSAINGFFMLVLKKLRVFRVLGNGQFDNEDTINAGTGVLSFAIVFFVLVSAQNALHLPPLLQ